MLLLLTRSNDDWWPRVPSGGESAASHVTSESRGSPPPSPALPGTVCDWIGCLIRFGNGTLIWKLEVGSWNLKVGIWLDFEMEMFDKGARCWVWFGTWKLVRLWIWKLQIGRVLNLKVDFGFDFEFNFEFESGLDFEIDIFEIV